MDTVNQRALWGLIFFVAFLLGSATLSAGPLASEAVSPPEIQVQQFHEGEILGDGVVAKTLGENEMEKRAPRKIARKMPVKKVEQAILQKKSGRSIAGFEEDQKFGNDFISNVRAKDTRDYDATMDLVHAAIERGEYGQAAKRKWDREKAGK